MVWFGWIVHGIHTKVGSRGASPPSTRPAADRGRTTDTGVDTGLGCFIGTLERLIIPLSTTLITARRGAVATWPISMTIPVFVFLIAMGGPATLETAAPAVFVKAVLDLAPGLATTMVIFESSTVIAFFFKTTRSCTGVEGLGPCPRCTVFRVGTDDEPVATATSDCGVAGGGAEEYGMTSVLLSSLCWTLRASLMK